MFKKLFKKTEKPQPVAKKKEQKALDTSVFAPELEELYACSVQKQATDFEIRTIAQDGQLINVAMDGLDAYDVKGMSEVYEPNFLGQEIIYTHFARKSFIGFNSCAILSQDWLINKCCALPCEDAIAIDYDIALNDEEISDEDQDIITQLKHLSNEKYNIKTICKEFAENKRKFGQSLCIPLVNDVDYSLPFNIDAVGKKSYRGMVNIEPIWVAPVLDVAATIDPLSPRFYEPTWFRLPNGKLIHHTWFVFNTYCDIPDILKPTYYFGGIPLPQLLYEQVYAAEKTAKEAPMLAQSKRLNYMEGNLNAYIFDEEKLHRELKVMTWLRNNWGWLFIKKDQRIGQLDTTLTDFDAVTMLGFQLVAAISGVQSARLLETSPKGWQSSGSLEDKNYSKLQLFIQTNDYCPILEKHYRLLAKSEYSVDKKYTCIFDEIDTPTEKERAEIREINSRTDGNYINAGVVSAEEVRGVLREDINSGYNSLAEEMEGEAADPFADVLGGSSTEQDPFSQDEWNEADHPRDEEGQFSESGGASKNQKNIKEILGEEIKDVKGQEAINVLAEKQAGHVKNAFTRNDTGSISLIWGDETKGLCHIIKRREEQGINSKDFLKDLGEVIEKGQLVRSNERGRYEIFYDKKMAVIEPELTNGELTFLLTAFKRRKP